MNNLKFQFKKFARTHLKAIIGCSLIGLGLYSYRRKYISSNVVFCTRPKLQKTVSEVPEYFEEVDKDELEKKYRNLWIIRSKVAEMLLGIMRDKRLPSAEFRTTSQRLVRLVIEEALASECTDVVVKESPLGYYKAIHNPRNIHDYVGVSILRSGNLMVEELMALVPQADIGTILLQRDESREDKKPIFYYEKLPSEVGKKRILLMDPMLGTGGSCAAAIELLKKKGVKEENIIFLNIIASVPGIEYIFEKYPKIRIVTSKVDKDLLPNKYIAPGLGDFGDRYFGTY